MGLRERDARLEQQPGQAEIGFGYDHVERHSVAFAGSSVGGAGGWIVDVAQHAPQQRHRRRQVAAVLNDRPLAYGNVRRRRAAVQCDEQTVGPRLSHQREEFLVAVGAHRFACVHGHERRHVRSPDFGDRHVGTRRQQCDIGAIKRVAALRHRLLPAEAPVVVQDARAQHADVMAAGPHDLMRVVQHRRSEPALAVRRVRDETVDAPNFNPAAPRTHRRWGDGDRAHDQAVVRDDADVVEVSRVIDVRPVGAHGRPARRLGRVQRPQRQVLQVEHRPELMRAAGTRPVIARRHRGRVRRPGDRMLSQRQLRGG